MTRVLRHDGGRYVDEAGWCAIADLRKEVNSKLVRGNVLDASWEDIRRVVAYSDKNRLESKGFIYWDEDSSFVALSAEVDLTHIRACHAHSIAHVKPELIHWVYSGDVRNDDDGICLGGICPGHPEKKPRDAQPSCVRLRPANAGDEEKQSGRMCPVFGPGGLRRLSGSSRRRPKQTSHLVPDPTMGTGDSGSDPFQLNTYNRRRRYRFLHLPAQHMLARP